MAIQQIDQFMASIKQLESGGRYGVLGPHTKYGRPRGAYQILDGNWAPWAKEAGIGGADWRDPRAQDRVARHKMMQYYRAYGSWDAVAVAWFAGPGRAKKWANGNTSAVANMKDVLGTSVAGYVEKMRKGMGVARTDPGNQMSADAAERSGYTPGGPASSYRPLPTRRQSFLDVELLMEMAALASDSGVQSTGSGSYGDEQGSDPTSGPFSIPNGKLYATFLDAFSHAMHAGGQHDIDESTIEEDLGGGGETEGMFAALLESYSNSISGGGEGVPLGDSLSTSLPAPASAPASAPATNTHTSPVGPSAQAQQQANRPANRPTNAS